MSDQAHAWRGPGWMDTSMGGSSQTMTMADSRWSSSSPISSCCDAGHNILMLVTTRLIKKRVQEDSVDAFPCCSEDPDDVGNGVFGWLIIIVIFCFCNCSLFLFKRVLSISLTSFLAKFQFDKGFYIYFSLTTCFDDWRPVHVVVCNLWSPVIGKSVSSQSCMHETIVK